MTVTHDQITALMPTVDKRAKALAKGNASMAEELASSGYLALCEAAEKWPTYKGGGTWEQYALTLAWFAMVNTKIGETGGSQKNRHKERLNRSYAPLDMENRSTEIDG